MARQRDPATRMPGRRAHALALGLLCTWALASCGESLPARIEPEGALEIVDLYAGQSTDAGGFRVAVTIVVENAYEETFSGLVDVVGNLRFQWVEHPEIEANVPVRKIEHLRLDPGERWSIVQNWNLVGDEGEQILALLNWSDNDIRNGVHYARPEHFVLDVTLTLFKETGLLTAEPLPFSIQIWKLAG